MVMVMVMVRITIRIANPNYDPAGCGLTLTLTAQHGYSFRNSLRYGAKYDTRCYFNVRSKADISQLNLPHGTDN